MADMKGLEDIVVTKGGYIKNADLLAAIVDAKKDGNKKLPDRLARMLMLLVARYARSANFVGYTFNEDMQAHALVNLCAVWHKFDETKYNNPFAFYTQAIKHSFYQMLNKEKKSRDIRDELLIDVGLNPSYGYTLKYEAKLMEVEDEESHEAIVEEHKVVNNAIDSVE